MAQSTNLEAIQKTVTQRQVQYLEVVNGRLPQRLAHTIENNLFTSVLLYVSLLSLALVSSVFSKARDTNVTEAATKVASEAKDAFLEEKQQLHQHFTRLLKQTNTEFQEKAAKAKKAADEATAKVQEALTHTEKELVRSQDEIINLKASHAEHLKLAKQKVEDGKVRVSDLHYQVAEKDKQIHALEAAVAHVEGEMKHEKEMHEASKEGLHEAMERLMDMKKQRS